jgi:hypothetical protein
VPGKPPGHTIELCNGCRELVRLLALGGARGLTAVIGRTVVRTRVLELASHIGGGATSDRRRSYVRRLAVTDTGVVVTSVSIARFSRWRWLKLLVFAAAFGCLAVGQMHFVARAGAR